LKALGFTLWRDREEIQIGDNWWPQILEAIRACDTMVLCMSPAALDSKVVPVEWHYARQVGTQVMPVVVDTVDFDKVPRWMKRKDWTIFGIMPQCRDRPRQPRKDCFCRIFIPINLNVAVAVLDS
jgi:hypothetical protein